MRKKSNFLVFTNLKVKSFLYEGIINALRITIKSKTQLIIVV